MKTPFKRPDDLSRELKMLPEDTRRRLLDNVNRRKTQIIEDKLLERQLKGYKESPEKKKTWTQMRQGMQKRREELKEKGILQPPIRYNKENFRSPLEELSRKSRANEIMRLENQRTKAKEGCVLDSEFGLKMKDLKLKVPKSNFGLNNAKLKPKKGIL